MFPLDAFAVHSVPFMFLVNWFEEILGGQVIDETGLAGVYGFELKERVNTPEALIQLLRDEAGLVITREKREIPTLIVRERKGKDEREGCAGAVRPLHLPHPLRSAREDECARRRPHGGLVLRDRATGE